ncbi:uncharacterized protein RSE6_10343 [Rhynchosporium secalis]|uniref:Uncharacterized protein n=1 Tax=Rhynchosporium secalis TaxID=38038 RepID=A0A1E1MK53_RHYSE|nr:uncharacterized protein RSE6_10343 [Rhynchosporium secalis]
MQTLWSPCLHHSLSQGLQGTVIETQDRSSMSAAGHQDITPPSQELAQEPADVSSCLVSQPLYTPR